jgi:hypothetical protein
MRCRLRCKVCHKRVSIYPIPIQGGHKLLFVCPRCNARGVFRNKNFIPFLFVRKISLASRQYFGVLRPSQLRLGGARFGNKTPNNKDFFMNSLPSIVNQNHNILKGVR